MELTLIYNGKAERRTVTANEMMLLPRVEVENQTFLGWNRYERLHYGFMNISPVTDTVLHAICTDGAAYVIESHFRGVPNDSLDQRCQFRRYVIDVYLENVSASCGAFQLENVNSIFYYFSHVPIEGIATTVTHTTNYRGGAYNDEAFFTTSDITVEWKSEQPVDARHTRQKIATLLLCFGQWGISYSEVARRNSDDIVVPSRRFPATADDMEACVSANFYHGIKMEDVTIDPHPTMYTVQKTADLPALDWGMPLARFAVLADTHVGLRYNWENYDWLHGIFARLAVLHSENPLDFVLQLGDNIDDGYAKTYQTDYEIYLQEIQKLTICDPVHPLDPQADGQIPHYELQGNHDTSMETRFFRKKLWYTQNRDGKKTAFIAFFTNYGGYPAVNFSVSASGESYCSYGILTDEVIDFVEGAVEEAVENGVCHIVLCNHFGVAQDLLAPILPETGLGRLEQLCQKYKIQLYLNGHEHNEAYTLRKYHQLYDYDVAMTHDKYAVFELYEKYAKVTVYRTADHAIDRIDVLKFD